MSAPTPQPASGASAGKSNALLIYAAVFVIAVIFAIGMLMADGSGDRAAANAAKQEQNIAQQLQKIGSVEVAPPAPAASDASAAQAAASAPAPAADASAPAPAASAPEAAASH